jgi:acetylornithine/succinyldiaminopimelate/putrescine aminotransferase
MANSTLTKLEEMRLHAGKRGTIGLSNDVIATFAESDLSLVEAVEMAHRAQATIRKQYPTLVAMEEMELRQSVQAGYVNFYADDSINPYIALAAKGPWVITSHGAVLHDNGGYGMLGLGHAPTEILDAMSQPWVMANVMTPSISQKRFNDKLRAELGHTRDSCPFDRFLCLNSGSESVTLACRIADISAKNETAEGARHHGKTVRYLGLEDGFHGRTYLPARASDSSRSNYRKHLASFDDTSDLMTVAMNDCDALRKMFQHADDNNIFFQMMLMEPIQGEGCPGMAVTREFYELARELTAERGTLLLVDSIQAGIRGTGTLSICDYPGFEDCIIPDMETWSKAINGGQYPLSVLGCNTKAADTYQRGVYGNSMTTNPRALEVGCAVMDTITPALRANIRERGEQLVAGLKALQVEMPGLVTQVQGTGLLCAAELDPAQCVVVGYGGVEEQCRRQGLGVIHGGVNALRFTPHFRITEDEVALVLDIVRNVLSTIVSPAKLEAPTSRQLAQNAV